MSSNWKKKLRTMAGAVSLINGFWAFQLQAGATEIDLTPIAAAVLSGWGCYFAIAWIIGGLRSDR
jgi:hypothetical protein